MSIRMVRKFTHTQCDNFPCFILCAPTKSDNIVVRIGERTWAQHAHIKHTHVRIYVVGFKLLSAETIDEFHGSNNVLLQDTAGQSSGITVHTY